MNGPGYILAEQLHVIQSIALDTFSSDFTTLKFVKYRTISLNFSMTFFCIQYLSFTMTDNFCTLGLKPKIAESQELVERSKDFIMINSEVCS